MKLALLTVALAIAIWPASSAPSAGLRGGREGDEEHRKLGPDRPWENDPIKTDPIKTVQEVTERMTYPRYEPEIRHPLFPDVVQAPSGLRGGGEGDQEHRKLQFSMPNPVKKVADTVKKAAKEVQKEVENAVDNTRENVQKTVDAVRKGDVPGVIQGGKEIATDPHGANEKFAEKADEEHSLT